MHIRESIYIEASPTVSMDAARAWMRDELQPLDTLSELQLGEISEGTTPEGAPSISTRIDQDGIMILSEVSALQHGAGTKLTMELRTLGESWGSKLRNLSFFPARKLLRNSVKTSLLSIRDRAAG